MLPTSSSRSTGRAGRAQAQGGAGEPSRLKEVLDLLATLIQTNGFRAAARAFVTDLAVAAGVARASLGVVRGRRIELAAISNASADRRSPLARALEAAMEEAADLGMAAGWARGEDGSGRGLPRAPLHAELIRLHGSDAAISCPLLDGGKTAAVLTVESSEGPIDPGTAAFCETALGLAGPTLLLKRRDERTLRAIAADRAARLLADLLGPGKAARKAVAAAGAIAVLCLLFGEAEHRVPAAASIEGSVRRAAVAPFDGYVAEAAARAGDVVAEGALLCRLEESELRLERARWRSQEDQLSKVARKALAERDAAQVRIVSAQLKQAQAQLALVDGQIARTRMLSPIAGMVVRGDLSQAIGGPVKRGDVLFEVAPLDGYRIVLEVDERDIGSVRTGQTGDVALVSLPGETFPIRIERITPIAASRGGKNTFRVEASFTGPADGRLRPGMEGSGKIAAGRRSLAWVWTHEIVSAIRLELWSWLP